MEIWYRRAGIWRAYCDWRHGCRLWRLCCTADSAKPEEVAGLGIVHSVLPLAVLGYYKLISQESRLLRIVVSSYLYEAVVLARSSVGWFVTNGIGVDGDRLVGDGGEVSLGTWLYMSSMSQFTFSSACAHVVMVLGNIGSKWVWPKYALRIKYLSCRAYDGCQRVNAVRRCLRRMARSAASIKEACVNQYCWSLFLWIHNSYLWEFGLFYEPSKIRNAPHLTWFDAVIDSCVEIWDNLWFEKR